MQCNKPIILENVNTNHQYLKVPCGKCMGCRVRRTSQWTMRLTHEYYTMGSKGIFLTLTYSQDPEKRPYIWSLEKQQLVKFFKRLRHRLGKEKPIKYYACGEYGDKKSEIEYLRDYKRPFGRPHYHCIILGISLSDDNAKDAIIQSWPFADWEKLLSDPKGQKSFGTVTPDSMQYTAKYIQKKFDPPRKEPMSYVEKYRGCEPEFQIQSQGIGLEYAKMLSPEIKDTGKLHYKGKAMGLPRYYLDKIGLDPQVRANLAIEKVAKYAKENNLDIEDALVNNYYNRWENDKEHRENKQTEANIIARTNTRSKNDNVSIYNQGQSSSNTF